jgi:hypothetical protein
MQKNIYMKICSGTCKLIFMDTKSRSINPLDFVFKNLKTIQVKIAKLKLSQNFIFLFFVRCNEKFSLGYTVFYIS